MKRLAKRLFALCLLLAAGSASAHRFHAGMTDITHNPRTGNIEIVHSYMGHDIEPLVSSLSGQQADLTRADDEAALRQYMDVHFQLIGADGKRLATRWVGMSADASTVMVYQEVEATPLSAVARIRQSVLTDKLPAQVNTVNITAGKSRTSLRFDRARPEQATGLREP